MQGGIPRAMETSLRKVQDVTIIDVTGRITVGEGNLMLREVVRGLITKGNKKILLNLAGVQYVDSSGVGERNQGGELRLVKLSKRVYELLQLTR
jgi:anti-sigma B factor antagonist